MSGETQDSVSGFTVDTLRASLLGLLAETDRRYEERFIAQERAVAKSDGASEKRFESVNEFRAQLADQATTFIPRQEAKLLIDNLGNQIAAQQRATSDLSNVVIQLRASLQGQDSGTDEAQRAADRTRTLVFAVIAVMFAGLSLFFGLRQHTTTIDTPTVPAVTTPTTATTAK